MYAYMHVHVHVYSLPVVEDGSKLVFSLFAERLHPCSVVLLVYQATFSLSNNNKKVVHQLLFLCGNEVHVYT